jgi:hypothetical protein
MTVRFLTPLRVEQLDNGRERLLEPFVAEAGGRVIEVPAWFLTDYASVPRVFWSLIAPDDLAKPAVLHDYLYSLQGRPDGQHNVWSRAEADEVFRSAMAALPIPSWKRLAAWSAVRSFGWLWWRAA